MDKQMFSDLMSRLDTLGAKISQTGATSWGWLVREQKLEGILTLMWAFVVIVFAITLLAFRPRLIRNATQFRGEASIIPLVASGLAFLIGMGLLTGAILQLANPEYFALVEFLHTVR